MKILKLLKDLIFLDRKTKKIEKLQKEVQALEQSVISNDLIARVSDLITVNLNKSITPTTIEVDQLEIPSIPKEQSLVELIKSEVKAEVAEEIASEECETSLENFKTFQDEVEVTLVGEGKLWFQMEETMMSIPLQPEHAGVQVGDKLICHSTEEGQIVSLTPKLNVA
jgi:hypothetical protein